MARLRFGYFIAPFHRAGTNPTLALQRDLEFVEHLDALGFDEVWIGEHHSAGSEIIGSPEVFIAAAARRPADPFRHGRDLACRTTTRCGWPIGDVARPPHPRPDHRSVLGPGSLHRFVDDRAHSHRHARAPRENLDIVVRLLAGETVTAKTATHELFDARLQLRRSERDPALGRRRRLADRSTGSPASTDSACFPSGRR